MEPSRMNDSRSSEHEGPCLGVQSHDWKLFCQNCMFPYPGTRPDDPYVPNVERPSNPIDLSYEGQKDAWLDELLTYLHFDEATQSHPDWVARAQSAEAALGKIVDARGHDVNAAHFRQIAITAIGRERPADETAVSQCRGDGHISEMTVRRVDSSYVVTWLQDNEPCGSETISPKLARALIRNSEGVSADIPSENG